MTTVDITLSNGQLKNSKHEFVIGTYFKLQLNKLLIIKSFLEAHGTDSWLIEAEKRTWQK